MVVVYVVVVIMVDVVVVLVVVVVVNGESLNSFDSSPRSRSVLSNGRNNVNGF